MNRTHKKLVSLNNVTETEEPSIIELPKGSATPLKAWEQDIEHALRHLGDRTVLASSRLARLAYIEKLAVSKYYGHVLPRGLALHDTLLLCVEKAAEELGSEPGLVRVCTYLQLAAQGLSCQEISRQLGLSREHISRSYRKKAIRLLTHQFLSTITNGQ